MLSASYQISQYIINKLKKILLLTLIFALTLTLKTIFNYVYKQHVFDVELNN